jgi:hypothetical protein
MPLSDESIKVRIDPYLEIGARVNLMGCEVNLKKIGSPEKARLIHYFESVLIDNHYLLKRRLLEESFRLQMVARINGILSQKLVADVSVYGLYSKEYGPG